MGVSVNRLENPQRYFSPLPHRLAREAPCGYLTAVQGPTYEATGTTPSPRTPGPRQAAGHAVAQDNKAPKAATHSKW